MTQIELLFCFYLLSIHKIHYVVCSVQCAIDNSFSGCHVYKKRQELQEILKIVLISSLKYGLKQCNEKNLDIS